MEPGKSDPSRRDTSCSCSRSNCSCLRCKHAACETRSCSRCTSHNVRRHPCLAAVAHAHRQVAADAVVVLCLEERASHVGLTCQLLIRSDIFVGGRLRRGNSCCMRHSALQLKHSDGDGEVELGQVQGHVDRTITWLCCWADRERNGPLVGHGPDQTHQDAPCAWNQAGNPKARRAEPAVSQESVRQGSCRAEIVAPHDHRALRPTCLSAGDQRFCAPQSRPSLDF